MITFNEKDFNVPAIVKAAGFSDSKTKFNYRVYGLKMDDNPAILLEYRENFTANNLSPLVSFLNNNKISAIANPVTKGKNHVYIGIRLDVREKDVALAVKIVQLVVYFLEGILSEFNPETKVKNKSFKDNSGKTSRKTKKTEESILDFVDDEPKPKKTKTVTDKSHYNLTNFSEELMEAA